ncbi:PadR family transcriptional regulator [Allonocardiopsis opalescens]|uniref:PadR family transcriptional regulator n=1 Tax=Allonocardiopsis opalescens TaxID=1144618 RepID=A0A2T0QCE9_9ACTN|nr:PadR family transcriptional regulator [Allonocardiopsis opalescens]PRY01551.1 PadR family transcriptional regulator [Allonocardiopsis opalescens]
MSLRHALLGLITDEPASGWDLTNRCAEIFGPVWPAGHPQIYGELSRLTADGLIEVDHEGPRRRKVYRVTDTGTAELRRWLAQTDTDHTMRFEPLVRAFFFQHMTPGDLTGHLGREARYYREQADKYRELAAAKDRGDYGDSPRTHAMRITVEAAVRLFGALADWAEWAQTATPLTAPRAEGDRHPADPPPPE